MGNGLDIGFGGDPIVPSAICMDQPQAYAAYRNHPQHLHGDARDLHWFSDNALDYIYSSHVLEDFVDTTDVLKEWLRVLRPGGLLVLFLPDEQLYRADCVKGGRPPNPHHHHASFSLTFAKACFPSDTVEFIHERERVGVYSFELVAKKLVRSP